MTDKKRIKLENVRLSFPSLFRRSVFDGKEGKYEATFIIDKDDTDTINRLKASYEKTLKEANVKVSEDKFCMKDGDKSDDETGAYKNKYTLKASNNKRPLVLNLDASMISEEDNVIYPGCYVNASIDFWVQNNSYGKRLNSNLYGVQFVKDGEPLGNGNIDASNDFSDLTSKDELEGL